MSEGNELLKTFAKGGEGACQFPVGQHYVLVSVTRVTGKEQVEQYMQQYGLGLPALNHTIKALGFKLFIDDNGVQVFRYSKHEVEKGADRWLFTIKSGRKAGQVFSIGLQVFPADPPTKVDFLTRQKIDVALQIYRDAVAVAELHLKHELQRIYGDSVVEYKEQLNKPVTIPKIGTPKTKALEKSVNESLASYLDEKPLPEPPKKHLVRFKQRR